MPLSNRRIQKIQPTVVRTQNKTITRVPPSQVNSNQPVKNQLSDKLVQYPTKIDKIWNDEVVYIIGGGPSLKDFDWNKLKGKKVIAINRAFQVLPEADVLYWTDSRFYRWFKNDIDSFKGLKVTCRDAPGNPGDITVLKPTSNIVIDLRPDYIATGNNSGFGAICLAAKLGAKRIYLLGYDMISKDKNTHWHSGYDVSHNHTIYTKMKAQFAVLPGELKKYNIEVFNANPKSTMDTFRRVTIEAALNNNPILPSQGW